MQIPGALVRSSVFEFSKRRGGGIEPLCVSTPRELKSRPSTSPTHPGLKHARPSYINCSTSKLYAHTRAHPRVCQSLPAYPNSAKMQRCPLSAHSCHAQPIGQRSGKVVSVVGSKYQRSTDRNHAPQSSGVRGIHRVLPEPARTRSALSRRRGGVRGLCVSTPRTLKVCPRTRPTQPGLKHASRA